MSDSQDNNNQSQAQDETDAPPEKKRATRSRKRKPDTRPDIIYLDGAERDVDRLEKIFEVVRDMELRALKIGVAKRLDDGDLLDAAQLITRWGSGAIRLESMSAGRLTSSVTPSLPRVIPKTFGAGFDSSFDSTWSESSGDGSGIGTTDRRNFSFLFAMPSKPSIELGLTRRSPDALSEPSSTSVAASWNARVREPWTLGLPLPSASCTPGAVVSSFW